MLTTYMQNHHITEAYKAGAVGWYVAALARELVRVYGADITGPQAISAATELEGKGVYTFQIRHSYSAGALTYDLVTAAAKAAGVNL